MRSCGDVAGIVNPRKIDDWIYSALLFLRETILLWYLYINTVFQTQEGWSYARPNYQIGLRYLSCVTIGLSFYRL